MLWKSNCQCSCSQDYLDVSKGIVITVTDKNIEISNPGALIAGNSVYSFSREINPTGEIHGCIKDF